jgi:hypothetical protein
MQNININILCEYIKGLGTIYQYLHKQIIV